MTTMNLAQLSRLDIKDLKKVDYNKAWEEIRKRPDILVNLGSVLLTIVFAGHIYSKNHDATRAVGAQTTLLQQKIASIDAYNEIKNELNTFLGTIPVSINEEDFINTVTDFASAREVQIKSFSPAGKKDDPFFQSTRFVLNITSGSYAKIWLFIHDIEQSAYPFRIESWQGTSSGLSDIRRRRSSSSGSQSDDSQISVQMEIASINFKKDD
jgi:Tfp pilus assembly protein PilO